MTTPMTDPDDPTPPPATPRWLRRWAAVTALWAAAVVVLGSLITTFRVGMADPLWPTEPWFLVVNSHVWAAEPASGFLIEHTHRLFAWGIGLLTIVLAFGAAATHPVRTARASMTGGLCLLLGLYVNLHITMRTAWEARKAGVASPDSWVTALPPAAFVFCALIFCGLTLAQRSPGRWFRFAAVTGLAAVMVQGLLGGFRVYLDQLMGTQLAAIHGSFGQVTLALLTAVAVLAARRRPGDELPAGERDTLTTWTVALVAGVVVQLVWGVWVRHLGSPVAQRLHILTAFAVVALVAGVVLRVWHSPAARQRVGGLTTLLGAIVVGQLLLGVEAYLGKFALTGPEALKPPELRAITTGGAVVRTAHTLLGAALLSTAVALAVRVGRRPVVAAAEPEPAEAAVGRELAGVS